MFHFIAFLFIAVIVILVAGLSLIGSIIKTIFGLGRRPATSNASQSRQAYYSDNQEKTTTESGARPVHKKIFTEEEGEYVDFEEIKS